MYPHIVCVHIHAHVMVCLCNPCGYPGQLSKTHNLMHAKCVFHHWAAHSWADSIKTFFFFSVCLWWVHVCMSILMCLGIPVPMCMHVYLCNVYRHAHAMAYVWRLEVILQGLCFLLPLCATWGFNSAVGVLTHSAILLSLSPEYSAVNLPP